MARNIFITFPNGHIFIEADIFFPCQQQYIRLLDKIIALNNDPQYVRQWIIQYLENRINTETNEKNKNKLKKNCEFMRARYERT